MTKKIRVCLLVPKFSRTKDEHDNVRGLASALAKEIDVDVVAPHGKETKNFDNFDNVDIYRFSYFFPKKKHMLAYDEGIIFNLKNSFLAKIQFPLFCISAFFKVIKVGRKCDIINAQWLPMGFIALLAKPFHRKPVIVTERHAGLLGYPEFMKKFVLRRADKVIAVSSELFDKVKVYTNNVVNIPNFVDNKSLLDVDVSSLKKEFNIKNEKVVMFLSRLDPFYDPITFIDAVNLVVKDHKIKGLNIKFFVVGDGPLMEDVNKKIKDLGLGSKVVVVGFRNDANKFFVLSDIFVTLSPVENLWARTIIESILAKTPCILTNAGETNKFFEHKKNAMLVKAGDGREVADSIINLILDKDLCLKITKNAYKMIQDLGFSKENVLSNTLKAYNEILVK